MASSADHNGGKHEDSGRRCHRGTCVLVSQPSESQTGKGRSQADVNKINEVTKIFTNSVLAKAGQRSEHGWISSPRSQISRRAM